MSNLNQVLLRAEIRVGADLDAWLARGGGEGLARALEAPDAVIGEIAQADLRGMGAPGLRRIANGNRSRPHPRATSTSSAMATKMNQGLSKIVFSWNIRLIR